MISRRGVAEAAGVAAVIAVAAIVISQSWMRWLDPIIDTGRDLYIPEQIRGGAKLYREFLYFYPPLTPYLLAAVTAFTGSSLGAYFAIGLTIAGMTAGVLWISARAVAGPLAAFLAALLFVSSNIAPGGGFGSNYFFPYAHSATIGMLFFIATVAFLISAWPNPSRAAVIAAVGCATAASWTKIEYAAFSAGIIALAFVLRTVTWRVLAAYAVALAGTIAAAVAYFGVDALTANVFPSALTRGESARLFYSHVTGASAWPVNVAAAFRGALLTGALVALLAGLDRELRSRRRAVVYGGISLLLAIVSVALAGEPFYRGWTVLQIALIPVAFVYRRGPLPLLLFASLCATSRIFLQIAPIWYGFVFTVPLYLLIAYIAFQWLPERGVYSRRLAIAWVPLIILTAYGGIATSQQSYESRSVPVVTFRGTYYDGSDRARVVTALLRHLETDETQTLVVVPEGLTINYLAGIATPLRHHTFTPVEIASAAAEREVHRDFREHPPEAIAVVTRDVGEFGYRGFGIDYAQSTAEWIQERYRVTSQWREGSFGALLLERRD